MSAAQPSQFFSRMKSAFQADPGAAIPQAGTSSPVVSDPSQPDHLALIEEAIAEAEQQSLTTSIAADPLVADVVPGTASLTPPPANPLDSVAQAVPSVIAQQTDTLNPGYVSPTPKEIWQTLPVVPDAVATDSIQPVENLAGPSTQEAVAQPTVEAGAHAQYVEVEPPSPEIPVEVEGYLQEVKDHQEQLPQEIVIAADQVTLQPTQNQPLRPVVVLPITPEMETAGLKKNPSWSLRWLVTWSRKLMKMFAGKIIYRPEESA